MGDVTVNIKQQRALAWDAFRAGVENGGDSSPSDGDYEDIQKSISVAFDHWWRQRMDERKSHRIPGRAVVLQRTRS
jgi:hypothetical protein